MDWLSCILYSIEVIPWRVNFISLCLPFQISEEVLRPLENCASSPYLPLHPSYTKPFGIRIVPVFEVESSRLDPSRVISPCPSLFEILIILR